MSWSMVFLAFWIVLWIYGLTLWKVSFIGGWGKEIYKMLTFLQPIPWTKCDICHLNFLFAVIRYLGMVYTTDNQFSDKLGFKEALGTWYNGWGWRGRGVNVTGGSSSHAMNETYWNTLVQSPLKLLRYGTISSLIVFKRGFNWKT